MNADETAVAFCQARERYRVAQRATKEARAEQADATRTLGTLLTESLARHAPAVGGATIAASAPDGSVRYLRLSQPAAKAVRLRSVADAVGLLNDVARHVADVATESLPDAVAKLVQARARQPPPPDATPRLHVARRPPKRGRILEAALVPREARTLSESFAAAHAERDATRTQLRPLHAALRAAESAAEHAFASSPAADAPAMASTPVVEVRAQRADGKVQTLALTWRTAPAPRRLGIRAVCACVREQVQLIARDEHFDCNLQAAVRAALEAAPPPTPRRRLHVSTRRHALPGSLAE